MRYFKHNDLADLERVLLDVAAEDRRVRCASVSVMTGCTLTLQSMFLVRPRASGASLSHVAATSCRMTALFPLG